MFILLFYIDFNFKIYVYNFYCLSSKEITDTKIKTSTFAKKVVWKHFSDDLFDSRILIKSISSHRIRTKTIRSIPARHLPYPSIYPLFPHRADFFRRNNEMIQKRDINQCQSLFQTTCECNVWLRRRCRTAGMIMRDNQAVGVFVQCELNERWSSCTL